MHDDVCTIPKVLPIATPRRECRIRSLIHASSMDEKHFEAGHGPSTKPIGRAENISSHLQACTFTHTVFITPESSSSNPLNLQRSPTVFPQPLAYYCHHRNSTTWPHEDGEGSLIMAQPDISQILAALGAGK